MIGIMAAAALGTITGATAAAIAFGAILSGKREDQRAGDREADALRSEVQGVAVHTAEVTDGTA
ncbi:hypothetical protein [Sphingomonas beigongshangi]|uniref:hypothetical protein n=1 Tax=Sphingomonas beigongshangi TaxID=2782540 RepID=UPI00193BC50B|nr:hypothetical protein [Sphingomonas beigongshangi]